MLTFILFFLIHRIVEYTANINIPVADGIISIRPELMDSSVLDNSLIKKIDPKEIQHLRTLKSNLDILMAGFGHNMNNN